MMKIIASLMLLLLSLPIHALESPSVWYQQDAQGQWQLDLYVFWSMHCPHCKEAVPVMERIAAERPWLRLHSMELTRHPEYLDDYVRLAGLFDMEPRSVPAFFYCGQVMIGFDHADGMGRQIGQQLDQCYRQLTQASVAPGKEPLTNDHSGPLRLPWLGELDRSNHSLLLLTVVIAALDAFNPCAFFVLLFLLSMLVHMRSRRRMLFIGGVFVLVSGGLYFLFIAAWLNLFLLLGMQRIFTLVAGVVALGMAAVNIKDYLRPGQGLSLSIPESKKPGLFMRMRNLLQAENLAAMTAATITLAVAANTYELLCTAGLPMVYTRILTLEDLPTTSYYLYLLLYSVIYVVPLLLIVGLFTWSMGQRKMQAHEGQLLKLLAGVMMLLMGLVLLFAPGLLSSLPLVLGAMVLALLVTGLAWWRQGRAGRE